MDCADATDLRDYEQREQAERVAPILDAVRRRGDEALPDAPLRLSATDILRCVDALGGRVVDDFRLAHHPMRVFAEAQRAAIPEFETEAMRGVRCGVRHVAVASAGVCLPARPSGVSLQAAQAAVIAARAAGVERVVACVPAASDARPNGGHPGRPNALLIGAVALAGAQEIYLASGVPALAALTFGTESVPRVETVIAADAGDGEMTEACRQLAAIGTGRLRPGILIVADDDADPDLIAADLISAHGLGPQSRGVLITTSPVLAAKVSGAVERQLDLLPYGDDAARTWQQRGMISLAADAAAACRLADRHGLACVELMTGDPRWYLNRLRRCRHVFLGESAGAALADHVLAPASPLTPAGDTTSVATFLRAISYREGNAADAGVLARLRRLAGLETQARACEARARDRQPSLAAS
jgi:sulfopropanediol 3-dehydrogenase